MMPISREIRVVQLLTDGELTIREIARKTGASRSVIGAIVAGKRAPDYSREQAEQRTKRKRRRPESGPPSDADFERCPGCGGMVIMPCLTCRVASREQRRVFTGSTAGLELGFDLRPAEAARLAEVQSRPGRFDDPRPAEIDDDLVAADATDEELRVLEQLGSTP